MLGTNNTEIAFGLDISDRSLRLIQLKGSYHHPKVQFYNEIRLPIGCIDNGEIKKPKEFLALLLKLIKTKRGRGKLADEVVAVLPESRTYLKLVDVKGLKDETNDEQTAGLILEALPQQIPLDPTELYFDWQKIETTDEGARVLIGAAPKNIVDSYVLLLSQAGLIPTVLEIEAAAIARTLVDQQGPSGAKIVIDIGANRTGLFLYNQDVIDFTVSLPISGNKITRLITETIDLDWDKAEQAKVVCGLDQNKCQGAVLEIFSDTIDELDYQIKQAIAHYQNNFNSVKPVDQIILTGGGANFINIDKVLEQRLKIKTLIGHPWESIPNPDSGYFTPEKSQSFTTALGLALRGLKPETFL